MTAYPLDIIIPVWNRPVEVRAALASFVADSPLGRLVMVNNGSERETEAILDEFAEALDDRALLLATERNIGSVAALNLGISKSSAPFVLVATPFTRLNEGWFDPVAAFFEEHPDAGAVVLKKSGKAHFGDCLEADHGSFEAMILRRTLLDIAGGFDEGMAGGEWTLRDYARRSLDFGYRTFSLRSSRLEVLEQRELGSIARREDRERTARQMYSERWGEPQTFLLICAETLFGVEQGEIRAALLAAARQGHRLIVAAENRIAKTLVLDGFSALHENISFQSLPRFFSGKALAGIVERAAIAQPATILISEADFLATQLKKVSFADFLLALQQRNERYYQRGIHA